MNKAFNNKDVDFTKEYMFFGEQPNVSRYDVQRYPIFQKLIDKHLGFFWKPDEIDLSKDHRDFKQLSEHEKHIFMQNLSYQVLLDSTQSRSVNLALLPYVSIPELETLIEVWGFSESIHNLSYSWILRNITSNPAVIFDDIVRNKEIMDRAQSVTKYYDDFMEYASYYNLFGIGKHEINGQTIKITKQELKKKLLLCVAAINILEGVRFYVSFACAFAFAENDMMEGNAKIISLIARDENLHLAITQNILKKWASGEDDPEMKKIYESNLDTIEKMFDNAVLQEKAWAAHLFKNGSMIGLNERILNEYVEYIAGRRLRALGIKNDYPFKNPLSWTDKYLKSSSNQVAPQESEIINYIIGGIEHDLKDDTFKGISF